MVIQVWIRLSHVAQQGVTRQVVVQSSNANCQHNHVRLFVWVILSIFSWKKSKSPNFANFADFGVFVCKISARFSGFLCFFLAGFYVIFLFYFIFWFPRFFCWFPGVVGGRKPPRGFMASPGEKNRCIWKRTSTRQQLGSAKQIAMILSWLPSS